MANVQFGHTGDLRDGLDVEVVQGMAGVQAHPEGSAAVARVNKARELIGQRLAVEVAAAECEGCGVLTGVELAGIKARGFAGFDLGGIGFDERRDRRAGAWEIFEAGDVVGQAREIGCNVEATFGGEFLALLRDEGEHVYASGGAFGSLESAEANLPSDAEHFFGRAHLEVQAGGDEARQGEDIVILDVATIFAQMDGDDGRAAQLSFVGGAEGIGLRALALLAEGGDVIDVDAEVEGHFGESDKA